MTASMWRMNGLWRRMAGVLVLCALLLSNEVMCQDDPTDAPAPAADDSAVTDAAASAAAPDATAAQAAGATATAAVGGEPAASAAPGDSPLPTTNGNIPIDNIQDGFTTGATAAPVVNEVPHIVRTVVPKVMCVGKEGIPESDAVKAAIKTDDCVSKTTLKQEERAEPGYLLVTRSFYRNLIWPPTPGVQRKWLTPLRGRRLMCFKALQLEIWP
ncbi:uncharacterized protein LOC119489228 [Sebastes umbrosus]|uniref:uncharacterized protein LOC119489228 n=1 Tax=Sebastes umbrosus TaxID=72105 RepID=UPI00189D9C2B|nr:uncharacterized protein LOC119489228 [Sebastes umbrosus]